MSCYQSRFYYFVGFGGYFEGKLDVNGLLDMSINVLVCCYEKTSREHNTSARCSLSFSQTHCEFPHLNFTVSRVTLFVGLYHLKFEWLNL